jgi:hypothetical protein
MQFQLGIVSAKSHRSPSSNTTSIDLPSTPISNVAPPKGNRKLSGGRLTAISPTTGARTEATETVRWITREKFLFRGKTVTFKKVSESFHLRNFPNISSDERIFLFSVYPNGFKEAEPGAPSLRLLQGWGFSALSNSARSYKSASFSETALSVACARVAASAMRSEPIASSIVMGGSRSLRRLSMKF